MAIEGRLERIKQLLNKVRVFDELVSDDNLEPATIDDIKGKAKDLCDATKSELDNIKAEIDNWE